LDADSALAGIVLGLSFVFYALFSVGEGHLLWGFQRDPAEEDSKERKALSPFRDNGVRSSAKVVLVTSAIASGAALLLANTSHWWVVVPGILGLVVSLAVFHAVCAGIGARWGANARQVLPLLWPLVLLAVPLARLQSSIVATLSGGSAGISEISDVSLALAGGPQGGFPETQGEEALAPHERRMITSILRLDETTAREIMVPRMDILAAEATATLGAVADLMWETGHSRIPIFEETIDNIVGVVHSRDLLRHLTDEDIQVGLGDIARPPLFIPEPKHLDELLRDFQEKHIQVAIVVDEYGGTAGLVTIEDLLEEIVGEIEDEFDVVESLREMLSEDEALMDARISLEEVNQVFEVNLQGEGFDTLGGLLYQQLGKIPSPGDEVEVDGLKIKVISTLGRRIKKVQVARTAASESR
jgi:CBS domain containing-hemolysin-like protein